MAEAMTEARVKLEGACLSCYAPNGVLISYGAGYDYLCARCASRIDIHELAGEHLVTYLSVALSPWREHWLSRGLTASELANVFDSVAHNIEANMGLEAIEARDAAKEAEST